MQPPIPPLPPRYAAIKARLDVLRFRHWRLDGHGVVVSATSAASPVAAPAAPHPQWRRADAQLIAHAPEDLAALLIDLVQLQAQVSSQDYVRWLEAEVQRLRRAAGEPEY